MFILFFNIVKLGEEWWYKCYTWSFIKVPQVFVEENCSPDVCMETQWSHRQLISINKSSAFSLGPFVWMRVSNLFRNCQYVLSLIKAKDYKVELKNMTWIPKWQMSKSEPNIKEDKASFFSCCKTKKSLRWMLISRYFVLTNNILFLWPEEVLTTSVIHFFKTSWKQIGNTLF